MTQGKDGGKLKEDMDKAVRREKAILQYMRVTGKSSQEAELVLALCEEITGVQIQD